MSRDIFVQDLPPGMRTVADIPDDFRPRPLGLRRADIISAVKKIAPHADFTNPAWGQIDWSGPRTPDPVLGGEWLHADSIEVNLGEDESVDGFAFHVRGGIEAIRLVAKILRRLNLQAIDSGSESGLSVDSDAP